MSKWSKLGRALAWVTTNAAWTWVAWTAVHGGVIAGNLLKFGLWLTLVQALLVASFAASRRKMADKGPPVPIEALLIFDTVFALLLAAFGWFGYAALAWIGGLVQCGAYTPDKPPAEPEVAA